MARSATSTRRARPVRRPAHGANLDSAVKGLLKALPVGHLDLRLSALERWVARLEKDAAKLAQDVSRLASDVGRPGAPKRPARPVRRQPVARRTTRRASKPTHLPVERELVHPGD